jgi:hypothetical protein
MKNLTIHPSKIVHFKTMPIQEQAMHLVFKHYCEISPIFMQGKDEKELMYEAKQAALKEARGEKMWNIVTEIEKL